MVKFRGMSVYLNVRDLARSRKFYEGLGFRKAMEFPDMSVVGYDVGGATLLVGAAGDWESDPELRDWLSAKEWGAGALVMPTVDSVDDVHAKAKAIGAEIEEPPTDQPWGSRTLRLIDPDGYVVMFDQEARPRRVRPAKAKTAAKRPAKAKAKAAKRPAKAKKAARKAAKKARRR